MLALALVYSLYWQYMPTINTYYTEYSALQLGGATISSCEGNAMAPTTQMLTLVSAL
eukprot:SAG11_NODE_36363_length_262_cov_0.546012_1_plen_56_part_01